MLCDALLGGGRRHAGVGRAAAAAAVRGERDGPAARLQHEDAPARAGGRLALREEDCLPVQARAPSESRTRKLSWPRAPSLPTGRLTLRIALQVQTIDGHAALPLSLAEAPPPPSLALKRSFHRSCVDSSSTAPVSRQVERPRGPPTSQLCRERAPAGDEPKLDPGRPSSGLELPLRSQ